MLEFEGRISLFDVLTLIEEKLSVGIWRIDAGGQMQWSRGLYELLRLDPRTTTPSYEQIQTRIHPDDRGLASSFGGQIPGRSSFAGKFRVIRPNGALRWIYGCSEVLLDASGKQDCVLGLAVDITEQHNLLQPLEVEVDRYKTLMQVAGGVLWIASPDGRITAFLNAEQTSEAQRLFGRGWVDLLHADERDAALRRWSESIQTARPYDVEHRLRQADGSYRWYRCKAAPVATPDGIIREWVGLSMDVHYEKLSIHGASSKLTGAQLRAARGMLNWSVKQLAERTGISLAVIRRIEEYNDAPPMPDETMETLRDTFSEAGIEFLFPLVGKPGIRPR